MQTETSNIASLGRSVVVEARVEAEITKINGGDDDWRIRSEPFIPNGSLT